MIYSFATVFLYKDITTRVNKSVNNKTFLLRRTRNFFSLLYSRVTAFVQIYKCINMFSKNWWHIDKYIFNWIKICLSLQSSFQSGWKLRIICGSRNITSVTFLLWPILSSYAFLCFLFGVFRFILFFFYFSRIVLECHSPV